MKFRPGAICTALLLGIALPATSAAQSPDAFVLPPGMFRLSIQGTSEHFNALFAADGSRSPLAGGLTGDLTADRFTALTPLVAQLGDFFTSTDGGAGSSPGPIDLSTLSLGTLEVQAAAGRTFAPATLAVGILPRIEIGASIPLTRGELTVQNVALAGGTVGINPDQVSNEAILASIGWEGFGASPLLPTADSPAGIELQNRVTALAGQPLSLPEEPADPSILQALLAQHYGLPPLASGVDAWSAGDLDLFAKFLVLSTFGPGPVPADPRGKVHLRLAASAGVTIATSAEPDSFPLLAPRSAEGVAAIRASGAMDLFLGSAVWASGSVEWHRSSGAEVMRRVAPADAPLAVDGPPSAVTVEPRSSLRVAVAPRFRLTESIAIGARYSGTLLGDTRFSGGPDGPDAELLNLEGGTLQRVGAEIRYSSMPAFWRNDAWFPAEITLSYLRNLAGPEGTPAGGIVTVTASLLPRFWGRTRAD